jgi:hypothetical protein
MQYNPTKRFMKISLVTLFLSIGHNVCATAISSASDAPAAKQVTTATSKPSVKCAALEAATNALNAVLPALEKLQDNPEGVLTPMEQAQLINSMRDTRGKIEGSLKTLDPILKMLHCSSSPSPQMIER